MRPRMVGTINGYVSSRMRLGKRTASFDGTIKGLTDRALELGAKPGAAVYADFGAGMQRYTVISAPHDSRCGGFWMVKEHAK